MDAVSETDESEMKIRWEYGKKMNMELEIDLKKMENMSVFFLPIRFFNST
jgi:hypothetical protein